MSPRPRLSLSSRLCIAITSVIVVGMVAVSLPQQVSRQRVDKETREGWVRLAAEPLVETIRMAGTQEQIRLAVDEFGSKVTHMLGYTPAVRIEQGVADPSLRNREAHWTDSMIIDISSTAPGIPPRILIDAGDFGVSGNWTGYWIHVLATVLVTSSSLYWVLRLLIALPLERLLNSIRIMEMGYWGEAECTGGVWEVRWIAKRFREMALRLERTVGNLVEAERRGTAPTERSVNPTPSPVVAARPEPSGES